MPYKMEHNVPPNLPRLCMFGSRFQCKIPSKLTSKLDHYAYKGLFVVYGGTDKHIRYVDGVKSKEKIATNTVFD